MINFRVSSEEKPVKKTSLQKGVKVSIKHYINNIKSAYTSITHACQVIFFDFLNRSRSLVGGVTDLERWGNFASVIVSSLFSKGSSFFLHSI